MDKPRHPVVIRPWKVEHLRKPPGNVLTQVDRQKPGQERRRQTAEGRQQERESQKRKARRRGE
ncbi:MAG TPA: hypothetical protein VGL91_11845 [Acidobacteriota bacterium]